MASSCLFSINSSMNSSVDSYFKKYMKTESDDRLHRLFFFKFISTNMSWPTF